MNFGNIEGLVNGVEQVIFDSGDLDSPASSISTGNILNGDEDGWYTFIIRTIGTGSTTTSLQFNGDTGSNYGYRGIYAQNTSTGNASNTGRTSIPLQYGATSNGYTTFIVAKMYAKSGAVRLVNHTDATGINGTSVDELDTGGSVWSNTADNLISAQILGVGGNLGVGTRVIILKSNNLTNGTPTGVINTPYIKGAWVRVGSSVLGAPASSITFSGLNGDRQVMYYLSASVKCAVNASEMSMFYNAIDTYGEQYLYASNTTVGAARPTYTKHYLSYSNLDAGNIGQYNSLIFAKSGFVRPSISTGSRNSGTTVTDIITHGGSCSNTADNITSLTFNCTKTNGLDTGSQFDLYALYL